MYKKGDFLLIPAKKHIFEWKKLSENFIRLQFRHNQLFLIQQKVNVKIHSRFNYFKKTDFSLYFVVVVFAKYNFNILYCTYINYCDKQYKYLSTGFRNVGPSFNFSNFNKMFLSYLKIHYLHL